jgi:hypothetical protein
VKRMLIAAVVAGAALAGAANADAAVIKTNWSERLDYANGKGFLRIYVRTIQVTHSSWKASVGFRNSSTVAVQLSARLERPNPNVPFTYWAGPGIWWSSYVSGGTWWPGAGSVLTHSARATLVRPAYPTRLAPGKSWFGTFSGSTAKVPRDRLLRIGFGTLDYVQPGVVDPQGRPIRREVVVSTTHQFKLPRRR